MLQNMCPGNGLRMGGLCGKNSKVKIKSQNRDSIFDFLFLTFEFLLLNSLCWASFLFNHRRLSYEAKIKLHIIKFPIKSIMSHQF